MPRDASDPLKNRENVDVYADESLQEEILRRIQQIDSGAVQLIPWEEVELRLRSKLHS